MADSRKESAVIPGLIESIAELKKSLPPGHVYAVHLSKHVEISVKGIKLLAVDPNCSYCKQPLSE